MTAVAVAHAPARPVRVWAAVQWALAALVVLAACGLAIARLDLHMSASAVLTGSMRPTFAPGDAVVTRPVPVSAIKPGMIILATPRGETAAYAHRVIDVKVQDGSVLVRTQGDANPVPDAWQDVLAPSATVSEVVGSVPKLGYLIEVVHGHTTQRNVAPVAMAGVLITLLAAALILCSGPVRHSTATG